MLTTRNIRSYPTVMSSIAYNIEQRRPVRVAILRALKLGDLLCFIPAVRALKAASPSSSITLIGLPWARSFARRFPHYFDDFIEFPGWPGFPERPIDFERIPRFLTEMQRAEFDLALQCQGSGSHANDIVSLFHAKHSAGFHQPHEGATDLNTWLPYPAQEPEIWRWLEFARHLGGKVTGDHLEFPIHERDFRELASIIPSTITEGPYIIIHLGAMSCREHLWPTPHFVTVARHLYHKGYEIVLTGTQDELELVQRFKDACDIPTINVCGQTSLDTLGALVRKATAVVSHDTGISHLAVALETPSVVIHERSGNPGWPPLHRIRHRFLSSFSPIQPATVIEELEDLLWWHASNRQSLPPRTRVLNPLPTRQEIV